MTLKVIYADSVGTGIRADLTGVGDNLFVQEGVMVARTDGAFNDHVAIRTTANSNTLDIRGSVAASMTAVQLGDDASTDFYQSLDLSSTALVKSFDASAIRVNAYASDITNAGHIEGYRGIEFNGQSNLTTSSLTNSGSITGEGIAIYRAASATENLVVNNTGTIKADAYAFYSESTSAAETINNKGTMSGDIDFGGGADRYDGRQGTLDGYIVGGAGGDTLYGGAKADTFYGGTDADFLDGGAGDDWLEGGDASDILVGGAGNDTLIGGGSVDNMSGGKGNDTYGVDIGGDVVIELAGEGIDTVNAGSSYTLTDNVEKLVLVGSDDMNGTGNALANTISGNDGKNTLKGMAGNDTLDGGFNADRMEGGTGNDTYVVDSLDDTVVEVANAGTDTVKSSVNHTLSDNVERLVLTGGSDLKGTGNEGANILTGNTGKNTLMGMAGNDTLKGLDGADTLNGGAGIDRMEGGTGSDTYIVDNVKDVVVELAGAGTDTVKSSVSHTLAANVERLTLTGGGAISGTGNTLSNILTGNTGNNILKGDAGNDTLIGGKGADQLYGGSGKDMFVFKAAGESTVAAQDKIFDFSASQGDRIDLHGVDANSLAADDQAFSFIAGSAFHKVAGELRFEVKAGDTIVQGDVNGDGAADFSFVLDTVVNLKASDFLF